MAKIKFTKKYHDKQMKTEFPPEKLDKILDWVDKIITPAKNHLEVKAALISAWEKLPEGKLTKAFLYQVMVLNGVIDDGVHDKTYCNQKKTCRILKYYKNIYPTVDNEQICWNLAACLLLPCFHVYPPFLETNKEELILE